MKILTLLVLFPFAAGATTYELADLKALESQQWKGIAERATTALLDTLELKDERQSQNALNDLQTKKAVTDDLKSKCVFE